jgi:predicted ArsR family transcriptional regulator
MTEPAAKPRGAGLSADEFSAAVSAVTSAFGDPTRRDIYLFPNVARHHLEKLTAGGYLTVELARHETAGRPSKRYRAGELDTSLNFPPRRDDLLATLLARSLELLDPDQAAAMAEEVGYDYGVAIAARMTPETDDPAAGHRSVRAALATVADALTAHGFAAHAEASGGSLTIVSEQCPFGDAAKKYPHVVCSVDRGMIRGMLAGLYGETRPLFTESRPAGDDHCVARV